AHAFLPLHQKIHLRTECRASFFRVKLRQEGIVFAIVNAARVQPLRQDARQRGFAHAQRPFDHDEPRGLRTLHGYARLLRRGFRSRHVPPLVSRNTGFSLGPRLPTLARIIAVLRNLKRGNVHSCTGTYHLWNQHVIKSGTNHQPSVWPPSPLASTIPLCDQWASDTWP